MKVIVVANTSTHQQFTDKGVPIDVDVAYATSLANNATADAYFYLLPETQLQADLQSISNLGKLVFANAVITTLRELPANVVRVNAWPGFFSNKIIELAASATLQPEASALLTQFGWDYRWVPDIPGFITARTVAMIINEAYFALGDEVSTEESIDVAMKLGTNYPYGPFEWARMLGLNNIIALLNTLAEHDNSYKPAPELLKQSSI